MTTTSVHGERAQAKLFAAMLRQDIADMRVKVTKAESDWQRRRGRDGDLDPPDRIAVVRARIAEAERMLDALNARFLRTH